MYKYNTTILNNFISELSTTFISKHSLYGYNTHKGIVAHIELYF